VNEDAVDARGQYFHTELLELGVFLGDRRELRASNEGEIARVEAKQHSFAQILVEFEIDEFALVIRRRGEIRGFPSDQDDLRLLLALLMRWVLVRRGSSRSAGRSSTTRF
jgi:hypothetical protein